MATVWGKDEASGRRPWVTLGDSITEGFTWQLWVTRSLEAAGKPAPDWVNAGVGGETAGDMLRRLNRDVLDRKPGRVFFSAGVNDAVNGDPKKFPGDVDEIFKALKEQDIPVCVLTTTMLGKQRAAHNGPLEEMNAYLRDAAARYGFDVAEVQKPFVKGLQEGRPLLESDDVHLTIEGYRVLSAAVLHAIDPAIPLSESFDPRLEPGVMESWQIRVLGSEAPVWTVKTPDAHEFGIWWHAQERKRGYIMDLKRFAPEATKFAAAADFEVVKPGALNLRVGGQVESLTIDGETVPIPESRLKWGIREVGVTGVLEAGKHRLSAVVGDFFFISCDPGPASRGEEPAASTERKVSLRGRE